MRFRSIEIVPVLFITMIAFLAVFAVSSPANAQDNTIKIIGDDGSVSVYDIKEQVPPAKEEIRSVTIKKEKPGPEIPPDTKQEKEEIVEAAPAPLPEEQEEKTIEAAAPAENEEQDIKTPEARKEEKIEEKAAQKPVEKAQTKKLPPLPLHKPPLPERLIARQKTAPGIAISEKLATAIAIGSAPPSNGFRVSRSIHNERPVYIVMFKTNNGPYEVLVDAETGDILKN